MATNPSRYFSIRLTPILMKIIGFWNARTRKERLILRFNYLYLLFILGLCLVVELKDLYYCRHDLYEATYAASSTIPLFVILIKTITFTIRRKEIMWLIEQTQKHFWYKEYDVFGTNVMDNLNKRAIWFICSYSTLIHGTILIYTLIPIIEIIRNGDKERTLPFAFRLLNLPTAETPYYEILFTIETISAIHSSICFTCFDNFLCMLCLHLAGQFKILQNRLTLLFVHELSEEKSALVYNEFRDCVKCHQLLLSYAEKLECVFCFPLMFQLLISSVVLCVSGFQFCSVHGAILKQLLFVVYFFGSLIQIFLITLNCNTIMEQSTAIGNAVYSSSWERTTCDKFCQFRKNMLIVMLRTKRPSYITAGKFFPISLESFTKVLSASASYLTLLQAMELGDPTQ